MSERRVTEVRWLPRSETEWAIFTAARLDAAKLWNAMVSLHARIRRLRWRWPPPKRWDAWARGRFPAISAQSVQQTVGQFIETLDATTKARKAADDEKTARYPWRRTRYRDVTYTNQSAVLRDGVLRLSHGRYSQPLRITLPRPLPGRLMEVTLAYGVVRLVCEVPAREKLEASGVVGVDLGVNTLLAVTDGQKAVLVSGREAKALVQYRNKSLAILQSKIDRCKRGSKRRKRLVRTKYTMLDRSARQLRDVLHKATRRIADAFPAHHVVVGKPFNDAARKLDRMQAQQVSSASNRVLIAMLAYKMFGADEVPEHYSSQTCPGCGCRQICRRVYKCMQCSLAAPRDVIGCTNIRRAAVPDTPVPTQVEWARPLRKYPGVSRGTPGSAGGTPARAAA